MQRLGHADTVGSSSLRSAHASHGYYQSSSGGCYCLSPDFQWTPFRTRVCPSAVLPWIPDDGVAGGSTRRCDHGSESRHVLRRMLLAPHDSLFVLGVMNMLWMAALTAFMLVEKVIDNKWISRTAGLTLVAWGCGSSLE